MWCKWKCSFSRVHSNILQNARFHLFKFLNSVCFSVIRICLFIGEDVFQGDLMDMMALLNCSINFIIYCAMSRQFRTTFQKICNWKVQKELPSSSQNPYFFKQKQTPILVNPIMYCLLQFISFLKLCSD